MVGKITKTEAVSQEPVYRVGTIIVPKLGAEDGVYVQELQADKKEKLEIFVSPRVIRNFRNSGRKTIELKDGQLVKYKVNPEIASLVEEITSLIDKE